MPAESHITKKATGRDRCTYPSARLWTSKWDAKTEPAE